MTAAKRSTRFALLALLVVALVALGWRIAAAFGDGPPPLVVASWQLRVGGDPAQHTVTLPAHLDALLPRHDAELVLHTEATIPPELRGQELTLSIPYAPGLMRLDAGGAPTVSVLDDLVVGYRSRGPHEYRIPAERVHDGVLALDLVVQHRFTHSGWFDTVPRLHRAVDRDAHTVLVRAVNDVIAAFAFGALFQLGLTYLTAFPHRRTFPAHVYFAVQILSASWIHLYYLGFTQGVFGVHDIALTCVTISLAAVSSVYFTHAQFGLPSPSRLWPVLLGVNVLLALCFPGPFDAPRIPVKPMLATVVVVIVYQLVVLGRLTLRRPRPFGAEMVLGCWIVLGVMSLDDLPAWWGYGELFGGARGDCAGLAIFAILQSALLAREHIASRQRGDALNVELADRVDALERREKENAHLTEELRRQITDRSRQLFAALALVGTAKDSVAAGLAPGALVQDRYRVVSELGKGGMGTVYEVVRETDGTRLALKVARQLDGASLARLAREAHVASTLTHPNIVRVVDVDIESTGYLYIVLEYVDGPALSALAGRFGDVDWALPILAQIAEGIAVLHEHGIVHRDLKPANVLVADSDSAQPLAKVTDFGVSRLGIDTQAQAQTMARATLPPRLVAVNASVGGTFAGSDEPTGIIAPLVPREHAAAASSVTTTGPRITSAITEVGMLVGTPAYMAPELGLDPDRLSPRADVFSLGMIAFEMLAGARPFDVSPALERLQGLSVPPAPSIGALVQGLPPDVIVAIDDALALDPTKRPTARSFAKTISDARGRPSLPGPRSRPASRSSSG